MPTTDRLRPNEHTPPAIPREQPGKGAEQDTITRAKARPNTLPTKNGELVAQHNDLDSLRGIRATPNNKQFSESSDKPVHSEGNHPPIVSPTTSSAPHRVSGTHSPPAAIRLTSRGEHRERPTRARRSDRLSRHDRWSGVGSALGLE
jgi:hypothetical protein